MIPLLAFVLFLSFSADIAEAAEVLNVTMSKRGDHTILTVDILVTCWPTKVGVQLDYENLTEYMITNYTYTDDYADSTDLEVMRVEVDLGVLKEPSMVGVAAWCDCCGWGRLYGPVQVPEFPHAPMIMIMLFAALTVMVIILKHGRDNNVSCNRENQSNSR